MAINVSDNNPRVNYTATSGQTVFTVPFEFFASTDLTVYVGGSVLATSAYAVTGGSGSTGSITTSSGQTAGAEIAIVRDVPLERTTDLTSSYSASSLNDQLDRIVTQVADLDDRVSRSISLNDYEVGVSLDLPAKASRLGKTVQFNSTTGALEIGPSGNELTSIASIASDITSLNGIKANVTTVAGAISNVNSVGSNISSVTSVASSISNVNTVNTNIANVNSVAGSISDLNDVADSLDQVELVGGSISNVDVVGAAISNVNTVASGISNINIVAGISGNVATVAGITSAISTVNSNATNINTAATNIANVNVVANVITKVTTVSDNIANVNTVAPSVGYLSTVANNIANINTLAPISAHITTVAGVASSVSGAAANAAAAEAAKVAAQAAQAAAELAADNFDDTYLGAKASDPTLDNDGDSLGNGDLYFNTTNNILKVYSDSAWQAAALDASGFVDVTGDSMTGNLLFGDGNEARFGTHGDLTIEHDLNNSNIIAANNKPLNITANGGFNINSDNIYFREHAASNTYMEMRDGGGYDHAVRIFHSGTDVRLETTSTGVDITGTLTSDGLTVDGSALVQAGNGATATLSLNNGDGNGTLSQLNLGYTADPDHGNIQYTGDMILSTGGNKDRLKIASNGDISFYEDTGGTAKLSWSASNERLFLSGSDYQFGIGQGANQPWYSRAVSDGSYRLHLNGTGDIVTLTSSGRVGIGTSLPATNLDFGVTSNDAQIINLRKNSNSVAGLGVNVEYGVRVAGPSDAAAPVSFGEISTSDGSTFAEFARIDSSGNLLVGMLSANTNNDGAGIRADGLIHGKRADVVATFNRKTSDGTVVEIAKDNNTIGTLGSNTTSGQSLFDIASEADAASNMRFLTSSGSSLSERMRISSAGSVGIGTNDPATLGGGAKLAVDQGADGNIVFARGGSTRQVQLGTTATTAYINMDNASGGLAFHINGSEKARLDTSGNLLVGGASAYVVDAATITSGGQLYASRTSANAIEANRSGTDGEIIRLQKGGSTIGSIGSSSIGGLEITGNNSSRSLLLTTNFFPANGSGAKNNGVIDLGISDARWRDLYLSSSIDIDAASGARIKFTDTGTQAYTIGNTGTSFNIYNESQSSEAMRIDSSGRVLLGHTSSISVEGNEQKLQLVSSDADGGIAIARFNNNFGPYLSFGRSGSGTIGSYSAVPIDDELGRIQWAVADGTDMASIGASISAFTEQLAASNDVPSRLVFSTTANNASTPTERMRLDASGDLLVGTTDTTVYDNSTASSASNGHNIRADGKVDHARYTTTAGAAVLGLNRIGSDGYLAEFRKNGAAVGSIGTTGGDTITIGSGDTGLLMNQTNNEIIPWNTSTNAANSGAIDLGDASHKFKDLYLSGGVYLGGTGAANNLHDYEEGEFQMTAEGVSGGAFGSGKYVKVGSLVHFQWYSGAMNVTGSGNATLTGLPFTTTGVSGMYTSFSSGHNTYSGTATTGYLQANGNKAYFTAANSTSSAPYVAGNPKYVMINGTYYTDA